jgi:ABC-type lipoprotein release transport system permease subunit
VSAARLCAGRLMRRHVLGAIAVVLLIGLGGGAVLAAAAGARRTASAATRLYRRGNVADVEIDPTQGNVVRPADLDRLARLPEVEHVTTAQFFAGAAVHDGKPGPLNAFVAANPDGTWIYQFDRIGLLPSFRGRMPDPSRADEVVTTSGEARILHVTVGSTLPVAFAKFGLPESSAPPTYAKPITLHVVGIATTPIGLLHGGESNETFLFGTPALTRRLADRSLGATIYVQLRHPRDLLAFERDAPDALKGITFDFHAASQELTTFGRVARPFTATLWIFALVAALSTVLIVAQALVRMVRTDAAEAPELSALGATRTQRSTVAAARAGIAVLAGSVLAALVSVLASPLFPLGLVHRVEPDPGMRVDLAVLVLGSLAIAVLFAAIIVLAARRATRVGRAAGAIGSQRPSWVATSLARANAPVSVVHGARLAFQRTRSNTTASTASSLFGLVAAAAAISAALVFGANLRQLTTPSRYGQTWDAEITSSGPRPIDASSMQNTLTSASLASGITFGTFGDAHLGRRIVSAYGLQPRVGTTLPVAQKGRLAESSDEVAVGAKTLRQLGRSVGDTVTATASNGRPEQLHIVGETLLPSLNPGAPTLGADEGAQLTRGGLARLDPDLRQEVDFALVRLEPGVTLPALRTRFGTNDYTVTGASPPSYIASYGDVQSTPFVLAALITVLGVGVLAHLLITSVRANRRELAVIKTIGGRRRQVLGIVIVQALMLTGVALAVGLVIGIALGRGVWTRFVTGLGLAPATDIPFLQLAALVAFALTSAAVIAFLPARAATRVVPARILRSE